MNAAEAIRRVLGVTLDDMRSRERTVDRYYGRMFYTVYSGKKRSEVASDLGRPFCTIWRYELRYPHFLAENEEFRSYDAEIRRLVDAV